MCRGICGQKGSIAMAGVVRTETWARARYGPGRRYCKGCAVSFEFKGPPPKYCPCCSTCMRAVARSSSMRRVRKDPRRVA